jgi:hypothetical protein
VYDEMGDDVLFMMVNLVDGQQETKEKGEKYIAAEGFTFPVYFDIAREAATTYGISSIPTTIYIGSDGNIAYGRIGATDAKTLRQDISTYLLSD